MDQKQLQSVKDSINNLTVCDDLKAYKEQVLALVTAELEMISLQIVSVGALTNPVTFIAKSIEMNVAQLVNLEQLATSLEDDIVVITTLLEQQANRIPSCSL